MMRAHRLATALALEPVRMRSALRELAGTEWGPIMVESERAFVERMGVSSRRLDPGTLKSRNARMYRNVPLIGDVFVKDADLYYVILNYGMQPGDPFLMEPPVELQEGLEVGLLTDRQEGADRKLLVFADAIQQAIKQSIDGRKSRHLTFDWATPEKTSRLVQFLGAEAETEAVLYERAALLEPECAGAEVTRNELHRHLLREVKQTGFVREQDLLSRRRGMEEEVGVALAAMKECDLVASEFLLLCRSKNSQLTRIPDTNWLQNETLGALPCPNCGKAFREELVAEGYTVTSLGKKLTDSSHWMTVWLTQVLADLGVELESMLWNVTESSEEIDLVAEVSGELWIFELKDREFGTGDALPFNYRRGRYRADRAFVVTTETISPDAKRVFEELATESTDPRRPARSRIRPSAMPVYVEGLDKAATALRPEVERASLSQSLTRLTALGEAMGYDLGRIAALRAGTTET